MGAKIVASLVLIRRSPDVSGGRVSEVGLEYYLSISNS